LWGKVNEAGGDPVCNITSHRAGYIDLATGERTVVTDVLGSIALIGAPTMTRDGRLFAVGVGSPVVVYDLITDELVREFDVPGISTISADGSRILVGQSPLELRSVDDGSLLTVYQGNLSDAWFGPDESFIYAADFDGSVKLFDTASGALLSEFRGSQTRSANALLSVDGNSLFTDEGGRISRISNVRAGPLTENPAFELDLPTGSVVVPSGGLQLSDPLTHIPYSPGDGLYYQIVDSVGRLVRQSGSVGWSAMSPDGRYVAELPIVPGKQTRDGTPGELVERLQLVDARTGDVVLIFADTCEFVFNLETSSGEPSEACPNPLEPSDLVFSADGSTLAVRGWAWNAAVFDVVTGERLWTSGPAQYDLPSIQAAIGVSPRGDTVVTSVRIGASNDRYHFVDVATSEVLGVLTLDQVQEAPIQIVYSSTGSHVFVVDAAANLLVIDTDPWNLVSTLSRAQGGHLSDVALSPDDRLATTVGIDGVVRVWDWESETLVQEIDLGTSLTQVEFIDADHLLVVSRGGDVVVLTLDVLELAGIGRDRVTRKFSAIECATYRIDVCPSRADNASGSG